MPKALNSQSCSLNAGISNVVLRWLRSKAGAIKLKPKMAGVYLTIALLVTGLILAGLFIEQQNNKQYVAASRAAAQERLGYVRSRLEGNLQGDIQLVKGIVSLIATYPGITQEEFSRAAKPLFGEGSHLRNIGAAPDMVIRMMYPIVGNEKAIGLDYRKTPSQFEQAEKARITGTMVLAGPLRLVQGGTGIIGRLPVYYEDKLGKKHFWGLVSAVIDIDELYLSSGLSGVGIPLEIAIRGKDAMGSKGEVFFGRPELFNAAPVLADIALPNGSWQMAAVPRGGWPTQAENAWTLRLIFFLISTLILIPFFALARTLSALGDARTQVESEKKRLSATLENTPNVAVQWYDRDGRVTYWNRASENIFGWTAAEATGKALDQLIYTPDQVRHFDGMLEIIAATGKAQSLVDMEVKHRDGSARIINSTLFPIPGDDQPVFVCMGIDITEHKQAELTMRESEEKLRGFYELSPLGIALTDMHGHYIEFNESFRKICGYSAEELKELDYWELTPKKYVSEEEAQLEALRATGRYGPYKKEYIRKDGSLVQIRLNGMIMKDSSGNDFIWSIVEDVTEQTKHEQIKNEFISVVSHELRTPLTSIRGSLGLIAGGAAGVLSAQAQSLIDIAQKNCERLVMLVNDILDLNKIEAGKMEFKLAPTRLLPLLKQSLEDCKSYAEPYQVSYKLESELMEVTVNVDPDRMMQIMANLLSNAAKYSPVGGQVIIATRLDGQRVRVEVTDRGSGIAQEFYGKIFQKFSQADSSDTRKKGGTGLGLAITKSLVEKMGGNIGFDSVPDVRTTFFVEFPVSSG